MTYAWGSKSAIQDLLGQKPDHRTPWAELWMGAHAKAPSAVAINGEWIDLDQLIAAHPLDILGRNAAETFSNTLPYLFKVLAAERPLSIQAHPDEALAKVGFARENEIGIPFDSPERNYKDDRHKPECICALQPFTALNGFRPPVEIVDALRRLCPVALQPEIDTLSRQPDADGLRAFFEALMSLPENRRTGVIAEAAKSAPDLASEEGRWILVLLRHYPDDIGILSPVLLNLIRLLPGQAMFLPAGRLHAYLEGVGIELMANSDNVLRGGLTPKHIDVPELLKVLSFDAEPIEILTPLTISECERRYPLSVSEFELSEIVITSKKAYTGPPNHGAEILLCIEGAGQIHYNTENDPLAFKKGESVLIPADLAFYRITGDVRLFKAAVPAGKRAAVVSKGLQTVQ